MDTKIAFADLQFQGCFIEKINISNNIYCISKENMTVSLDVKNGIGEIIQNCDLNCLQANLVLDLTVTAISNNDQNLKYQLNIVLNGLFYYYGTDPDTFNNMLLLNGNSTLYSIARSHIITFTSLSSTSGQIVLPMINFVKLLENSNEEK